MKYLKLYEEITNTRLPDLKKLLDHLVEVFTNIGYYHNNFLSDELETHFVTKDSGSRIFDLLGDYSSAFIIIKIIIRIASNATDKQIPEYFKTIDGLKLYSEDKDWYSTTFQIVGDVDDIISQITKEDIETKIESIKYNL